MSNIPYKNVHFIEIGKVQELKIKINCLYKMADYEVWLPYVCDRFGELFFFITMYLAGAV